MDSLLSNAQRCARKADSLVNCGLYDESLMELEKSIGFLNELKSITTCYESVQLLNAQLESIDRKMRSVAIKRSESIKKKNQIESLINKNRRELVSSSTPKSGQSSKQSGGAYCKLEKDGKCTLEELSTTNAEYKKVNSFLIEEIENLKRENEFLRCELLKVHSSLNVSQNSLRWSSSISESSSSLMMTNQDSGSNTNGATVSASSTCDLSASSTSSSGVVPQQQQQQQSHQLKFSTPMTISPTCSRNNQDDLDQSNSQNPPIDLSRYINEEDEEDEQPEFNICAYSENKTPFTPETPPKGNSVDVIIPTAFINK